MSVFDGNETPDINEMIDKSPIVGVEKPEAIQEAATTVSKPESAQETTEVGTEKFVYTDEEVQAWKQDSDNKKKWQGELTRKSQLASNLTDDDVRNVLAMHKLRQQIEKSALELPDTVTVDGTDEYGDATKITISRDQISSFLNPFVEKARQEWLNNVTPQVAELESLKGQAKQREQQAGLVVLQSYFDQVGIDMDWGEDPMATIDSIYSSGKIHPDYDKLQRAQLVQNYAVNNDLDMKSAHLALFGKDDQKRKAVEKIKQAQTGMQSEIPGKNQPPRSDDEKFLDTLRGESVYNSGIF